MAGDGLELARVGDEDCGALLGEETADPRAVRAGLHGHGGLGKLLQQLQERWPGVGEETFMDHLASGIQGADEVTTIPQIKT